MINSIGATRHHLINFSSFWKNQSTFLCLHNVIKVVHILKTQSHTRRPCLCRIVLKIIVVTCRSRFEGAEQKENRKNNLTTYSQCVAFGDFWEASRRILWVMWEITVTQVTWSCMQSLKLRLRWGNNAKDRQNFWVFLYIVRCTNVMTTIRNSVRFQTPD